MSDKKYHAITEEQLSKLIELLELGLTTDGGHHKQWALVEIAELFEIQVDQELKDEGIAP